MFFHAFLIKYGEIGIKGKNRYLFEDALVAQIRHALKHVEGTFKVTKDQGRIYVHTEGEYDYDDAVAAMRRVFGIVGICPVVILEDEGFEKLGDDVVAYSSHEFHYLYVRLACSRTSDDDPFGRSSGNPGRSL